MASPNGRRWPGGIRAKVRGRARNTRSSASRRGAARAAWRLTRDARLLILGPGPGRGDELVPLSGKARLAGVMGWPVGHSLSPRLHGYWFERYGIDGAYVPLPVQPEDV